MNDASCVGGDDSVSLSASASSFLISHFVSNSLPTPLSVYSPRKTFLIYYICMCEHKNKLFEFMYKVFYLYYLVDFLRYSLLVFYPYIFCAYCIYNLYTEGLV